MVMIMMTMMMMMMMITMMIMMGEGGGESHGNLNTEYLVGLGLLAQIHDHFQLKP